MQKYEAIERGILENDLEALRESVGSICYTCRNFKNGEFDEVVEYVISRGIPLLDPALKGELVSSGKESFTDADFARAVFELKENFCEERIADVKRIGEALYPNDHEAANEEAEDGEECSAAPSINEATDETEGEYRSKYDNGRSNPIKSVLRAVCDFFSPKEESAAADESGDLFQNIVNGINKPTAESSEKFDTPLADHTASDAPAYNGAASGDTEKNGGDYFNAYRVSEDEMKNGGSSADEKPDTDAPEAGETSADLNPSTDAPDKSEESEKGSSAPGKIDPLYIAAGAVGIAALVLIVIAFLK